MPNRKLPPDALEFYFGLGPNRSYRALADHYQMSKKAITNRAVAERWQEKVAEREAQARARINEKAVETLEGLNERHLRMLKVVQGKALDALRSLPLSSGMEAVRALDMAIRQERLVRGEPTERSAADIEAKIRTEHERWLVADDAD